MKSKGPRYGLHLNMSKCEIFWPSGNQSFPEFPSELERVVNTKGGADFWALLSGDLRIFSILAFQLILTKSGIVNNVCRI